MDSMNTQINWEEFFIQQALELEEKMALLDVDSLNKSRLRIALDNGILDWQQYVAWYSHQLPCTYLIDEDNEKFIEELTLRCRDTMNSYSHFSHWSEDLLPLQVWDETLIVLGLQYNENLSEFDNVVFVVVKPDLLSKIYTRIKEQQSDSLMNSDSLENALNSSFTGAKLENVELDISAPKLSFANLVTQSLDEKTNAQESTNVTDIQNVEFWDFVTDRHDEYSFEARKQFDAYLVLKISHGKTKIFKSDDELKKLGMKDNDFSFDIKEDNPFHTVFYSEKSVNFDIPQIQKKLNFNISPYQQMCVTALKRGGEVLGFLVGLKKSKLSESDQALLNDLAKESA